MAVEVIGAAAKKRWSQKFPGSPVVRTLCSHCRRPGFNPWLGNWDPTSHSARQETNKEKSSLGWKYPQWLYFLPKSWKPQAHHSSSCSVSLLCFLIFVSFPLVLGLVLHYPELTICTLKLAKSFERPLKQNQREEMTVPSAIPHHSFMSLPLGCLIDANLITGLTAQP